MAIYRRHYNDERPHSALKYKTPTAYFASLNNAAIIWTGNVTQILRQKVEPTHLTMTPPKQPTEPECDVPHSQCSYDSTDRAPALRANMRRHGRDYSRSDGAVQVSQYQVRSNQNPHQSEAMLRATVFLTLET